MKCFLMHVGHEGAIDIAFTISRDRDVQEILDSIPADAPEREFFESSEFRDAFPDGRFNCWGVPLGAEPAFRRTSVGDIVLFFPEIGVHSEGLTHLGIVKVLCPMKAHDTSHVLWPETPNERLFPWLFFFRTEAPPHSSTKGWYEFLDDVGYKHNWNPRGWYKSVSTSRFDKFGGVRGYLSHLQNDHKFGIKSSIAGQDTITSMDNSDSQVMDSTGQGYQTSQEVRSAIELRAMELAKTYYAAQGWQVEDTSANRPYDLYCTRRGRKLFVEVKGTTQGAERVILTRNEVVHARDVFPEATLFVVHGIQVSQTNEGTSASGGSTLIHNEWSPSDSDLQATQYLYTLPS